MSDDPQKSSRSAISRVMILGTFAAMIVLAASVILMTIRGVNPDLQDYASTAHTPPSPATIMRGVIAFDPVSIAMLGVVMILLIPVARTLGAAYIFLREKDKLFAAMSLAIVAALIIGAWSHLVRDASDNADHPSGDAAVSPM